MSPTPNSQRRTDPGGFTLLELMLAVVILGLLLATVYGAVSRTISSKEHAEERSELFSSGRQAVLRMASDIEGALAPPSGDRIYFRGAGSGQAPTIEFVAMNRGGFGANRVRPGRVLIAYSLDPLEGAHNRFALRREEYLYSAMLSEADGIQAPEPEEGEETAPTAQATFLLDCPNIPDELNLPGACMKVASMRFRYYDEIVRDWRDEWDSTEDAMLGRLPAAVEIDLVVEDKDGFGHDFSTIVDLPLARGQPTVQPGDLQAANQNPSSNPSAPSTTTSNR